MVGTIASFQCPKARAIPDRTSIAASPDRKASIRWAGAPRCQSELSSGSANPVSLTTRAISFIRPKGTASWLADPLSLARLTALSAWKPNRRRTIPVRTRSAWIRWVGMTRSVRVNSPRRRRRPLSVRSSRNPHSRKTVRTTPLATPIRSNARAAIRAPRTCAWIPSPASHAPGPESWSPQARQSEMSRQPRQSQISKGSRKSNCCATPAATATTTSENSNRPKVTTRLGDMAYSRCAVLAWASSSSPMGAAKAAGPSRRERTSSRRRSPSLSRR